MTEQTRHAKTRATPGTAPASAPVGAPHPNGAGGTAAPSSDDLLPPPHAAVAPRRRSPLRLLLLPAALVILGVGAFVGYLFYEDSQLYVSTDNAQITGQPIQVAALATGRVARILPRLGGQVRRGQVIAQVALPSQTGVFQNGAPKLGFLGESDSLADVQSPIDGLVIALPATVGDTVAAGQPIVILVDPRALWVNANVEETQIGRVHVGQAVDVHIDALNTTVPGAVEEITPATAAVFSLLPASNASGNFNKVTQLVPIRIAVNLGETPTLLGASVEVKVHVAE